jgi:hypothetical protein
MSKKGLSLDLFIVFDTSPQLTNCLCDMCLKFMNGLKIFFFFYLIQLPTIDTKLIMEMKSGFTRGGSQPQLLTIHLMYCLT